MLDEIALHRRRGRGVYGSAPLDGVAGPGDAVERITQRTNHAAEQIRPDRDAQLLAGGDDFRLHRYAGEFANRGQDSLILNEADDFGGQAAAGSGIPQLADLADPHVRHSGVDNDAKDAPDASLDGTQFGEAHGLLQPRYDFRQLGLQARGHAHGLRTVLRIRRTMVSCASRLASTTANSVTIVHCFGSSRGSASIINVGPGASALGQAASPRCTSSSTAGETRTFTYFSRRNAA